MADPEDETLDDESPIAQSVMFTELFHALENCDSTRVYDFWEILDDTVLELFNTKDR
jgi:hypothetical protein